MTAGPALGAAFKVGGLSTDYVVVSTSLACRIVTGLPACGPRSGLERSDLVRWRLPPLAPTGRGRSNADRAAIVSKGRIPDLPRTASNGRCCATSGRSLMDGQIELGRLFQRHAVPKRAAGHTA
jgi:hypothetical protein